ncbi:MAG: PIN domain-containing protein [Gemmatimonadaceae bacterium]
MNVYVESNFVLELAYLQEQHRSCDEIVRMAEAGDIILVLPAFCISEPYDSFVRRYRERKAMLDNFQKQVGELRRSEPYAKISEQSTATTSLIAASLDEEKERLDETMRRVLRCAYSIPVTPNVFDAAVELQKGAIDSAQDAIIFASVVTHLDESRPAESVFLNKNAGDFADPVVQDALERRNCKLLAKFPDGLGYLLKRMRE